MPKIYKEQQCLACGGTYTGRGAYFCSAQCSVDFKRGEATGLSTDKAFSYLAEHIPFYEETLELERKEALVCADFHFPHVHQDMFKKLIKIAETYMKPPRTIIIGGDLLDFKSLGRFDLVDKSSTASKDLRSARLGMNILSKHFDEIYHCMGNHDIRMVKKLDWFMDVDDYAHTLMSSTKLIVTPYPFIDLYSNGIQYHISHPASYSRVGKVPVDLAILNRCSVLGFHGHLFSIRCEPSGTDIGYDVGCMTDKDSHLYTKMRETTHPKWTAGFAIIRDGAVYPYTDNPRITNWDYWLKELPKRMKNGRAY